TQYIDEGKYASEPQIDSRANWDFAGWYADGAEAPFEFDTPIYDNITLYAHWKEKETEKPVEPEPVYWHIAYVSDYGNVPNDSIVEDGKTAGNPGGPIGYSEKNFDGWFENGSETPFDFESTPITHDYTLYAHWSEKPVPPVPETVTVTFTTAHGTAPEPQTVIVGDKVEKPTDPQATGYIFGGWCTDQECKTKYDFDTPVTDYLILYAKWTEEPSPVPEYFTVTFYTRYGKVPESQLIEKGQKVEKPADPESQGHIFDGWCTDQECKTKYDFNTPVTAHMTLYAKWTEEPTTPVVTYKVTFYTERGTVTPVQQTVEKGKCVAEPVPPSAEGYVFGGWYAEKECKNRYNFNTPVTADITLFAKWTPVQKENFQVVFSANGHGTAPESQIVQQGQKASRPKDPEATGYVFNGWYIDPQGTQAYDFNAAVSSNLTLYAKWSPVVYTVRFDSNGGTGTMQSMSCSYGSVYNFTANAFARTGYTFEGWNTKADGTGVYFPNQSQFSNLTTTSGATVSLYAQWRNNYNVIQGIGAKIQKGGTNPYRFRTDGDYSKFLGITIDKNNVSSSQYTLSGDAGNTCVDLKPEFFNQMPIGTHTIVFNYVDGSCQTTFEILSKTPKTGDTNNMLIWIIIAIVCIILIGVIVLILLGKRKKNKYY
ncbi:MAG: InlB B-repeat-containing protein, partial [Parasporobacterium sp.]|nr:InlB B-repeat-containing protein [Parasporobacterium sp.]